MDILKAKKISDRLHILYEDLAPGAPFSMALVIGSERAALIDSGCGASGNLDEFVRSITDKPVVCLLTHGDPDHVGGAALFGDIRMSPEEQALLDQGSAKTSTRRRIAQGLAGKNKVLARQLGRTIVKADKFDYLPLKDGQIIDLGDQQLEVVSSPGHSPGSVCFWNEAENYLVAGDSIANAGSAVLFFKKCLPLQTFHNNLKRFQQRFRPDLAIYTGHSIEALDGRIIPELLVLCEEILAGQTAGDEPYLPPFLRFDPAGASVLERLILPLILKLAAKKELGDSLPREHKKSGFLASVKYNARKLT